MTISIPRDLLALYAFAIREGDEPLGRLLARRLAPALMRAATAGRRRALVERTVRSLGARLGL